MGRRLLSPLVAGLALGSALVLASPALAVSITPNGPAVTLSAQTAPATFKGLAGHQVSLLTEPAGATPSSCVSVTIAAPDGTQLYSHQQCGAPDFTGALILPANGTYGIAVSPPAATLALFALPREAAGTLAIGGPSVATSIATPGQSASFVFAGTPQDRVSLLTQADSALHQQCFAVSILAPDGKTQVYSNRQCGSADETPALMLPASGSYTVTVASAGPAVGTAMLTLMAVPGGPNNTGTPGSQVFATTLTGGVARFPFQGDLGGRVSVVAQADKTLARQCQAVALVAPDGKTRLWSHSQCGAPSASPTLTLPASGTYTLLLAGMGSLSGKASITLYRVPPDAAGSVAVNGAAADLATAIPGQGMRVTFAGTAGSTVHLAVTADPTLSSDCYTVSLASPAGAALSSAQGCDTSFTGAALTLPATGLYTVSLASTGTAVGTATIAVAAP